MTNAAQCSSNVSAPSPGRRLLTRAILMSLIWLGFTGADWNSWLVGGPTVVAAAWISLRLWPGASWRWSPRGALAFAAYFLRESCRGGWDVARRALSPGLNFTPGIIRHPLRLPAGPARLFFCTVISLLPGTAVVAIQSESIQVHVLDQGPRVHAELRALERRVAALFDLSLSSEEVEP